jgi:hypothetical protein
LHHGPGILPKLYFDPGHLRDALALGVQELVVYDIAH